MQSVKAEKRDGRLELSCPQCRTRFLYVWWWRPWRRRRVDCACGNRFAVRFPGAR